MGRDVCILEELSRLLRFGRVLSVLPPDVAHYLSVGVAPFLASPIVTKHLRTSGRSRQAAEVLRSVRVTLAL